MSANTDYVLKRWKDIEARRTELSQMDHLCRDEQNEYKSLNMERKFLFVINKEFLLANDPRLRELARLSARIDLDWSKEGF